MSIFTGFHRKITLPVLQNLLAAGVGAVVLVLSQGAFGAISGCSPETLALTTKAEALLAEDRVDAAARLASDALVLSPGCRCANDVTAAIEHRLMRAAILDGLPVEAERRRVACYASARKAIPLFGKAPRAGSSLEACSAERVLLP